MDVLTISIAKTVKILGLGRTTIYNLIAADQLEAVRINGRRLIKMESIRRLIEKNR